MHNDRIPPEMRARLRANREGRLTADQWKDLATQPLATLLVLLAPAILILGPRLALMTARAWWIVGVTLLLVVVAPLVLRARRYARAPIHFATLYTPDQLRPFWMFWKPDVFYTQKGEPVRFSQRLAPRIPLQRNSAYMIYYLEDPGGKVLLSIAPLRHPEADKWRPTEAFETRFARRAQS
jgi:hypothetical protein